MRAPRWKGSDVNRATPEDPAALYASIRAKKIA
jgi:hypothetical protein